MRVRSTLNTVQLTHAESKVAVRSLDEKMIMVGHETVGMTNPVVAFVDVLKRVQKVLTVRVTLKDGLFLVSTGGDMIDCAGVFDAERTGHGATIAESGHNDKKVDLTLKVASHQ